MTLEFTAVFRKVPEGHIGFVEERPGANTQGAALDEARAYPSNELLRLSPAAETPGARRTGQGRSSVRCDGNIVVLPCRRSP